MPVEHFFEVLRDSVLHNNLSMPQSATPRQGAYAAWSKLAAMLSWSRSMSCIERIWWRTESLILQTGREHLTWFVDEAALGE